MKELRSQLRERRKSIKIPTRKRTGKNILHQCQKNGLFRSAKHIAIFTPNDGEVETENTINFLKKRGYLCLLAYIGRRKTQVCKDW